MKHAIVTGATGFVGRTLIRELVSKGISVIALVRDISPKTVFLNTFSNVMPIVCPLENIECLPEILGQSKPDTVFYHLAWQGTAGDARTDCRFQLENVNFTIEALRTAQRMGCEGFIGAGSLMEYESTCAVYDTDTLPSPANIYSTAKLTAHYMSRIIAANENIRFVWPYITNAYGEEEESPRFLNTTVRKILTGKPLEFSAATQLYDFIHVSDAARAFFLLGECGRNGKTYCVGSGSPRALKEYITEMKDILSPDLELGFGDTPGISLGAQYFDTNPLAFDTGFHASISFREGIQRLKKQWELMYEN